MGKKKILIIASASNSLVGFRGDFIKNLLKNNFEVYTAAPNYGESTRKTLESFGAKPLTFKLQRTGLNPISDIKSIKGLKEIINKNKIDLVFPYTIKPVVYGSIAANLSNVPVISLITGLGFSFSRSTLKSKILQVATEFLYKISIRKNKAIVFQNSDDYNLFLSRKILSKKNKVGFVDGSGVNLNEYNFRENTNSTEVISFVVIARLIKEKGIGLFLEAAKVLKNKYPKSEFHIIGTPDNSPSAIKIDELKSLHESGVVIYHGPQSNIQEHLTNRDIFVLPTYYREGVPRSILEALSVGLPVITTNTPGCKETIVNKKNGILIEPKDLDELINAMEYFLINKDKIKEMGINSRNYAKERFDVKIINKNLLNIVNKVLFKTN